MSNRGTLLKLYGGSDKDVLVENTLLSHTQVGNILGITRQRVRQIEIYALAKVRAFLVKSVETYIPLRHMNTCAIAGVLARDAVVRQSQKSGKEFLTATVITERPSPKEGDDRMFSTYWDVLAFGQKSVDLSSSLKEGSPVFATGEVECRTYEGKDGTTKAGLKLVGTVGLLPGAAKGNGSDDPLF